MRIILLLFLLCPSARAEILYFNGLTQATNTTGYFAIDGGSIVGNNSAAAAQAAAIWPGPSETFDTLTCATSVIPPAGESWTIVVWKDAADNNFAATLATVVLDSTSNHKQDLSHTVVLGTGVSATFQVVPTSNVPANAYIQCSMRGTTNSFEWNRAEMIPLPPTSSTTTWSFTTMTETFVEIRVSSPVEGNTIKNLYCASNVAPGSGITWTFRVRRSSTGNNNPDNSPLVCTMTGTGSGAGITFCNDTIDSQALLSLEANDLQVTVAGGTAATAIGRCGWQDI